VTPLHLGVILPKFGPQLAAEALADTAVAAERSGFDSAWVSDHLIVPAELAGVYGTFAEALVSLAILVVAPTVASVTLGYNPLRALGFNFHSTIERDLPQAAAVIDPKNPVATGEALEEPRHRGDLDSDRGRAAREWYPHEGYAYGRATRRHRDLVRPGHRGRMEDR
jgi:hypothetical protein